MPLSRTAPLDTVIVVGGSIAGLLAAAATAPHARRVVVIERDELPVAPGPRPGTPHAAQTHMLLSSGRESLERLIPGAVADLLAKGALSWDADTGATIYVGGSRLARTRGSAPALAVSRFLLEAYLRERVRALPNVTVLDRTDARGLRSDRPGVVTGVRMQRLDDATAEDEEVKADLVVDATGRPGRASRWFSELAWPAPTEDRVIIGLRYATTHLPHRDGDVGNVTAVVNAAAPEMPRAASAVRQEDGTWTVTLAGYIEVAPPLDTNGFRAFAHTLLAPEIAELLDSREFLHRPVAYRFPQCVRRRIEAVQLPQGYAVLGDAICCFDPAWGQGMSVAALQAVALQECLSELTGSGSGLARALARYHRAAVRSVDRAWTIVTGEVFQYEGVVGVKPRGHAIGAAYLRQVKRVAALDPYVASAMARVFGLLDPPQSLIRPSVSLRVLVMVPARATLRQGTVRGRSPAHPDRVAP